MLLKAVNALKEFEEPPARGDGVGHVPITIPIAVNVLWSRRSH